MRLVVDCAQAGLIAGTVPTKGTAKRARKSASASVEAVLQATTTRSGAWSAMALPMTSMMRAINDDSGWLP